MTVLVVGAALAAPPPPQLTSDQPVSMAVPSPEFGSQYLAAVAYGGTGANAHWFAVWQEITPTAYVLRGARFDVTGNVIDAPALVIATRSISSAPSVAFDGTNFVVAW